MRTHIAPHPCVAAASAASLPLYSPRFSFSARIRARVLRTLSKSEPINGFSASTECLLVILPPQRQPLLHHIGIGLKADQQPCAAKTTHRASSAAWSHPA